jgi:uncharacterized protein (UPF0335 family)
VEKQAKDSSAAAVASLQTWVTELERLLAMKQDRSKRLEQEMEDGAKASQGSLESLRTDVERLTNAKEDLSGQLRDKDTKPAGAKSEASRLSDVLER